MEGADETEKRKQVLAQIGEALHDLCQPLTALQCRLEIGQMNLELAANSGDPLEQSTHSSPIWAECLRECARLNDSVTKMRSLVRKARADEESGREGQ